MTAAPPLSTDLALYLHGRPSGEAPALLLLHGLTDSGTGWAEAVRHWQDRFAVLAVDLRGHGRSPRFTSEQLAGHPGDVMVDDTLHLLEQLPEPPVVLGHSLGGAVALAAAVRRPALVRALVLEDPAALGPSEPQRDTTGDRSWVASLEPSRTAPDDEALMALRRAEHPDWPESELLETGRAEQQTDLAYLVNGDLKPSTRWPELVAGVAVPTLMLSGDATTRMSELSIDDDTERGLVAAANPHLRFQRIPAAGHCIRREQPARFYAAVDGWLAELGLLTAPAV
jgi:pimeloyl-ACP methyl ester carboxylesterase